MIKKAIVNTIIPWQKSDQWEQVGHSIRYLNGLYENKFQSVIAKAHQIRQLFEQLSDPIEQICAHTCGTCNGICCMHATIWFDLKDLLYSHFAVGMMPVSQIEKKQCSAGNQACGYFSKTGCTLPRIQRPFVCTWYFCPAQTQYLERFRPKLKRQIEQSLSDIKILRENMEIEFIRITS